MAQGETAKTRDGAMVREEIAGRLIQMRNHIEDETGAMGLKRALTIDQVALLDDVCRALGLDDGDVRRVLGMSGWWRHPPLGYTVVPFPTRFIQEGRHGEG